MEFHINIDSADGVVTVTVAGELDAATAVDCTERINGHRLDGHTKSVVIDVRDVTFIDAAGLRALAAARDRLSLHGPVRVANAPRVVSRLADILGVDLDRRREV